MVVCLFLIEKVSMSTQMFFSLCLLFYIVSKTSALSTSEENCTGEIPADAMYGLKTNNLAMVLHTDLHAFTRNFISFLLFKIQYNEMKVSYRLLK